jgi:hypothetical protein
MHPGKSIRKEKVLSGGISSYSGDSHQCPHLFFTSPKMGTSHSAACFCACFDRWAEADWESDPDPDPEHNGKRETGNLELETQKEKPRDERFTPGLIADRVSSINICRL